jgi:phytoene desaturase
MANKKGKKVIIVGAGPGGLTAGMILANRGYRVEILEKEARVGGRNGYLEIGGFKFDIGPTFLMLKPILEEVFALAGEQVTDHLKFYELDPMYKLVFKNKSIAMSPDHAKTRADIKKNFPGQELGFDRLLTREKDRFEATYPCLKKDYSHWYKLFNKDLMRFIPKMSFPNSMHTELGKYFSDEDLKMAFTFQSKYLGMSPWQCPAAYMIIPYIEHHYGIQHVEGGLSQISEAMAEVIRQKGGVIKTSTTVAKVEGQVVTLANGKQLKADKVVMNADVGYAYKNLLNKGDMSKKDFSCSTFMLYLGVDQELDWEHHTIYFSDDYKKFVDSVFISKELDDDFSMYIRSASRLDKTLAPKGCSNIYVLVPMPNNKSGLNWDDLKQEFRDKVIAKIKKRTGFDIESHIVVEQVITPLDWERDYNVFLGATFNLAHRLNQMLYFRPHNQIGPDTFLVGGGTHPGSGLPTIYESGRIAADLIDQS